jgi:hypothetical protein
MESRTDWVGVASHETAPLNTPARPPRPLFSFHSCRRSPSTNRFDPSEGPLLLESASRPNRRRCHPTNHLHRTAPHIHHRFHPHIHHVHASRSQTIPQPRGANTRRRAFPACDRQGNRQHVRRGRQPHPQAQKGRQSDPRRTTWCREGDTERATLGPLPVVCYFFGGYPA